MPVRQGATADRCRRHGRRCQPRGRRGRRTLINPRLIDRGEAQAVNRRDAAGKRKTVRNLLRFLHGDKMPSRVAGRDNKRLRLIGAEKPFLPLGDRRQPLMTEQQQRLKRT